MYAGGDCDCTLPPEEALEEVNVSALEEVNVSWLTSHMAATALRGSEQKLLPADETFPRRVFHIANPQLVMEVVWYGLYSTPEGSVPVVATNATRTAWWAGEAALIDGQPTLGAVNGYGDEATAKTYARSIFVL